MMQSNLLFWLLVCGHLLGDFYFQSEDLVSKKKNNAFYLGLHGIIYFSVLLLLLTPIMNEKIFIAILLIAASHLAIDLLKVWINKAEPSNQLLNVARKNSFFFDQLIHLGIIMLIAYYYAIHNYIALNKLGNTLFEAYFHLEIVIHPLILLRILFVVLLIGKPANILIREINKKENIKKTYRSESESATNQDQTISEYQNAGKIIGILERLIIVVMLILEQYAAIGLVLTAKSITRYDKISKEPSFAEYYLVGTLLSLLIAIAAVLLVQPI